jgi:hypothetical protein
MKAHFYFLRDRQWQIDLSRALFSITKHAVPIEPFAFQLSRAGSGHYNINDGTP